MKIVSTPYTLYNNEIRNPMIHEFYNPKVKIIFMTIYRGKIENSLKMAMLDAMNRGVKLFVYIEQNAVGSKKANEKLAQFIIENGGVVTSSFGKKFRIHAKCFLSIETDEKTINDVAAIDRGAFIISTGNWDSDKSEDIHVLGEYRHGIHREDDDIYKSLLNSFLKIFWNSVGCMIFHPFILDELNITDTFRSNPYKMRQAKDICKEIVWMIDHATKKIYIKCPLISEKHVIESIANAVERGVDVRILTKERPDKIYKIPAVYSDIRGLVTIRKDDDSGWIHKHSRFIIVDNVTALFTCNLVDSKRMDSYLYLGYDTKCIIGYDKYNIPTMLSFRNYFLRRFKEAKQEYWYLSNSKEWVDIPSKK